VHAEIIEFEADFAADLTEDDLRQTLSPAQLGGLNRRRAMLVYCYIFVNLLVSGGVELVRNHVD
jgi:hypothetical protein